jgi:transposase
VDETEVHLNPPLTRVWAKRGQVARVSAAGKDEKRVVFGGWNYRCERLCWQIHRDKDSNAFLSFVEQLLAEKVPGRRLVLVMDNASYHHAHKVQQFLADRDEEVEVFWLPAYSPELNLIEYAWGYLKETATNNYFFGAVDRMQSAVAQACRQLNSNSDSPIQLHFRTVDNFQRAA